MLEGPELLGGSRKFCNKSGEAALICMPNKLFVFAVALAAVAVSKPAYAAPGWHLSQPIANDNGACSDIGDGIATQVGYYGELTPRTGDNPNSAVVVVIHNGLCGPATVIPEFRLPPEVVQDTSQPVECYRARNGGADVSLSNFPSNEAGCWTTPMSGLPNVFGWSKLNAGERFVIYVPVAYIKPMTNGVLSVNVQNNFWPLVPAIQFNVDYRPLFSNHVARSNTLGTELTFSFKLEHFHATSQVYVDYGTTSQLGSTSAVVYAAQQYTYYNNVVMPTVGGLIPGTTYYWQVRIVTPYGSFVGPLQTTSTYGQIVDLWQPDCTRHAYLKGICP